MIIGKLPWDLSLLSALTVILIKKKKKYLLFILAAPGLRWGMQDV